MIYLNAEAIILDKIPSATECRRIRGEFLLPLNGNPFETERRYSVGIHQHPEILSIGLLRIIVVCVDDVIPFVAGDDLVWHLSAFRILQGEASDRRLPRGNFHIG